MLSKNYCVYKHTNLTNQKVYIGITSQKISHRWGHEGHNYNQQPKFFNAIQKYGWENFSHEVLYDNLTKEQAIELEAKLIAEYNSVENGYNCSFFSENIYTKKVKCLETEEKFISVAAAARKYQKDAATLSHHLNGDFTNAWGLHWIFLEDEEANKKAKNKIDQKTNKNLERDKNFIQLYQDGKTIREISSLTGASRETISKVLKKNNISFRTNKKKVIALDRETKQAIKEFETLTDACKWLNVSESNLGRLSTACKEQKLFKDYYWIFN